MKMTTKMPASSFAIMAAIVAKTESTIGVRAST
jgi:hypothetical protein